MSADRNFAACWCRSSTCPHATPKHLRMTLVPLKASSNSFKASSRRSSTRFACGKVPSQKWHAHTERHKSRDRYRYTSIYIYIHTYTHTFFVYLHLCCMYIYSYAFTHVHARAARASSAFFSKCRWSAVAIFGSTQELSYATTHGVNRDPGIQGRRDRSIAIFSTDIYRLSTLSTWVNASTDPS